MQVLNFLLPVLLGLGLVATAPLSSAGLTARHATIPSSSSSPPLEPRAFGSILKAGSRALTKVKDAFHKGDPGFNKDGTARKNILMQDPDGNLETVTKGSVIPPEWKTPKGFEHTG